MPSAAPAASPPDPRDPLSAAIIDAAGDAIVVTDESQIIRSYNRAAEDLFGWTKAEILGKSHDVLIPERLRGSHQAKVDEVTRGTEPVRRMQSGGAHVLAVRKSGEEFPADASVSMLRIEGERLFIVVFREVSQRILHEAARSRLEVDARLEASRLEQALESSDEMIAIFDSAERLLACNRAYRRPTEARHGRSPIGLSFTELLTPLSREFDVSTEDERRALVDSITRGIREPAFTLDIKVRGNEISRIRTRRTADGGFVQTVWDLTDALRREEELRETRAAAETARGAAEAASAAKSEFLSSMSHELRTPLNAILGFAQLLDRDKKEPLSERHRARVGQILKGGEHLLHLIDDVLDLSRIEAGRVAVSIEPVVLADVLEEILATLRPLADKQHVDLVLAPLDDPTTTVAADRTRFAQILFNLGSNAIKYNRRGGRVTFSVTRPTPYLVRTAVSDEGLGIPADQQNLLFQPFQRAGQETGPIEGTGIGLVITKRLAALMSGDVGFRSAEGEGSEFWVDLFHRAPGARASAPESRSAPHTLGGSGRHVVLYVEDNPANVHFIRDLVGSLENVDLVTASNAELGIAKARELLPRAIVMDINLPGITGFEALHRLQQDAATKDIPVIALTAAATPKDRRRGQEAGFFRYLTKPIQVGELESALEAALGARG